MGGARWPAGYVRASMPDVSVVIPVHNGVPLLGEQLDALVRQTFAGTLEVIVADNLSTDGTADFARRWSDRLDLRVVAAADGRGVNHARDTGVRAASADRILVCDADDVACDEWAERMVLALDGHDHVGGPLRFDRLNDAEVVAWYPEDPDDSLSCSEGFLPYAVGANCGFRRGVFDAIGGYDTSLAEGGDDVDFSWRAQLAGFTIGFVPGAWIDYRLRGDLGGLYRQMRGRGRGVSALRRKFAGDLAEPVGMTLAGLAWWVASRAPLALLDRRWRGRWVRAVAFHRGLLLG